MDILKGDSPSFKSSGFFYSGMDHHFEFSFGSILYSSEQQVSVVFHFLQLPMA